MCVYPGVPLPHLKTGFLSTMLNSVLCVFRADSLPKHHDMTDAVPVQLDTEFMSPGRVLKEINPDPAAAATSPDNVTKQPLDFRFSVSQLPSWAQKRVSVEEILFSTKKENYHNFFKILGHPICDVITLKFQQAGLTIEISIV